MSWLYAGLDVSNATTRICILDGHGEVVYEATVASSPAAIARELKPYRALLESVGQESGSLSQWLHRELSRKRLPMVCMDARAAHGVLSLQRAKTDVSDARGLANALRAGWYRRAYIRSDEAQRLRLLLVHRSAIKRKALDLEHSLRMSIKPFGARIEVRGGKVVLKHAGRRQDRDLARLVQSLIRARAALMAEAAKLTEAVKAAAKKDVVCRRLMSVPGVGPITALAYRTSLDDPSRFRSSRAVAAHFGLTPKRFQSGESDYSGGVSRLGDKMVRTALYQAAFSMVVASKSKCALRAWAVRLREQKGLRPACVALARKLAVILHRLWVTGRDFDATLAAPSGRTELGRRRCAPEQA